MGILNHTQAQYTAINGGRRQLARIARAPAQTDIRLDVYGTARGVVGLLAMRQWGQNQGSRSMTNDDRRRDVRQDRDEHDGFWGRGHHGGGFERDERLDYSREEYGAGEAARDRRDPYRGGSSRHGEEEIGGRGYGRQRDDLGRDRPRFAGNDGRGFSSGNDYPGSYGGGRHAGGDRGPGGYGQRDRNERGMFERAADEVSSWFGDRDAERRREQDYRGRGPKGYKRSDARIQEDVNDRLADDAYVDASEIEVAVSAAEVTLTGSVDSRQARRRAEDIAEQVSGVSYVQNNLRVRIGGSTAEHGAGAMAAADFGGGDRAT